MSIAADLIFGYMVVLFTLVLGMSITMTISEWIVAVRHNKEGKKQ